MCLTDAGDRLLRLIERVYAAPGSVEGWRAFLLDLATSFDGSGASFISHDFPSHQASVSVTAGFAPEDIRTYEAHWAALDPWACSPGVRRLSSGSVAVGEQLVTHAAMKRTAFYNEFGRHYDVVRCITGTIEIDERRTSVLSVNRSEHTGLTAMTTYYYRVTAYNNVGMSPPSNTASAKTKAK